MAYTRGSVTIDLYADEGCCEEASPQSRDQYIPCNAKAVAIVDNGDRRHYRMCGPCAAHNVRNRGARIVRHMEGSADADVR